MKNLFTYSTLLVAGTLLITSCNNVISSRKLDGEWTVSSGSISSSSSYVENGVTYNSSSNGTFNGSTLTTTVTSGIFSETYTASLTIDYTFDRKEGTYTSVQVENDPEYSTNFYQVFDNASGGFTNYIVVDRRTSRQATTTSEGFYTITGDAGDEIAKNSQIVFQERSRVETYTDTYSYFVSGTSTPASVTGKYYYDFITGDYLPFSTSATGTETEELVSSDGIIWNVTEMSGDEMMVEYVDEYTTTTSGSTNSTSVSTDVSWTLTAK